MVANKRQLKGQRVTSVAVIDAETCDCGTVFQWFTPPWSRDGGLTLYCQRCRRAIGGPGWKRMDDWEPGQERIVTPRGQDPGDLRGSGRKLRESGRAILPDIKLDPVAGILIYGAGKRLKPRKDEKHEHRSGK